MGRVSTRGFLDQIVGMSMGIIGIVLIDGERPSPLCVAPFHRQGSPGDIRAEQ